MKTVIALRSLFIALFVCTTFIAKAQFEFTPPTWKDGRAYQTLYVKIGDQNDTYTQSVMAVIRDNWTLCPVVFYTEALPENGVSTANLYMNFERIPSPHNMPATTEPISAPSIE